MQAFNFALPTFEKESFLRFSLKIKKNIPELEVKVGDSYNKLYYHPVIIDGYVSLPEKVWHEVCDVELSVPEINDWVLLATFKRGLLFCADPTKELKPSIPEHGLSYEKCDVCGHTCKNSYLISNTKNGAELQVGCECAKKFGLDMMKYISILTKELTRIYEEYNEDCCGDGLSGWRGRKDDSAFASVETTLLIKAAKSYYDTNPTWIKGYYEGSCYIKSKSSLAIRGLIGKVEVDDSYVSEVLEHTKKLTGSSDFEKGMISLSKSFYGNFTDTAKAFFMIKSYEDSKICLPSIEVGKQVKVEGEVIEIVYSESMYGVMTTSTIKTLKGYTVKRTGTIHPIEVEGKKTVSFYSTIKGTYRNILVLDRTYSKPKKGLEVVEL